MTRFTRTANGKCVVSGKTFDMLIGTRAQVWHGTAYKTSGGLTKSNIMKNKSGRIVSKSKYMSAKRENRLVKAGYGTKKGKFWRKGRCFLWAIRNSTTRYVIWLDSDVKVLSPIDLSRFWPKDGDVVSLICGNLKQAESGFVIVDTHHPLFDQWTNEYEQCWYNGIVDTLHRPWDNDVLWYVCKKLPHRNLSKSVLKSPQGFEDTDLLDYMYHYYGKRQKDLIRL